jgi:hypothetical protein
MMTNKDMAKGYDAPMFGWMFNLIVIKSGKVYDVKKKKQNKKTKQHQQKYSTC